MTAVAVVVCVKDEADRIIGCLEAVDLLGADEVLVVDGGSTDDTRTLARMMGADVHQSILGSLAQDRMRGVHMTRSPYVAYIDADHHADGAVVVAFTPRDSCIEAQRVVLHHSPTTSMSGSGKMSLPPSAR